MFDCFDTYVGLALEIPESAVAPLMRTRILHRFAAFVSDASMTSDDGSHHVLPFVSPGESFLFSDPLLGKDVSLLSMNGRLRPVVPQSIVVEVL